MRISENRRRRAANRTGGVLGALGAALVLALSMCGPAWASGPEWGQDTSTDLLYYGVPFSGTKTETYTGVVSFENEVGGLSCFATMQMGLRQQYGQVQSIDMHDCSGGGLLSAFGCEPVDVVGEDLPWPVTYTSINGVTLDDVVIDAPMKPGCYFGDSITLADGNTVHTHVGTAGLIDNLFPYGEIEGSWPWTVGGQLSSAKQNVFALVK